MRNLWISVLVLISVVISDTHALDLNHGKKVKISAVIYNETTQKPVPNAHIACNAYKLIEVSNDTGYFAMNLPPGNIDLEISEVNHKKKIISLKNIHSDTLLSIILQNKINLISEVTVSADKKHNHLLSTNLGTVMMDRQQIKRIPTVFGEADIIKAFQTEPGVSPGIEGLAGMYVRGGNGDENLFMIDGHPVYQVNHLGGLFSPFNPEAIQSVDFYKSSFPARYGGRLSSVVNVRLKEGDREEYHGTAMLGLTSGNINFEGPVIKGKTSFNISLRRSWLDILSIPVLAIMNSTKESEDPKTIAGYAFTDLNLKINHSLNDKSKAYLILYWGDDHLKIGEKEKSGTSEASFYKKDLSKLQWGNLLGALGWSYRINNKLCMNMSASYTRYKSLLKRKLNEKTGGKTENYLNKSTQNGVEDVVFQADFNYAPHEVMNLKWGTGYSYHNFRPEYTKANTVTSSSIQSSGSLSAHSLHAYIEDEWSPFPLLSLNSGLRFSMFSIQGKNKFSVEPRISARILFASHMSFKASYTRMQQVVQQMSDNYISLPTDLWMPISRAMDPLTSNQYAAGIYYSPHPMYNFSVEGYYKQMENLVEYKSGYNFLPSSVSWDEKLTTGEGRSYGMEFIARKESGKVTGWLGYGLLWSDRLFPELNGGERFPSKYDNRHKINVVVNWRLFDHIEINGSWVYMTGNLVTLSLENYKGLDLSGFPIDYAPINPDENPFGLNYYGKRNNIRLPSYHRLDAGISFYRPKEKGRMGIWTISVYNAYCRMNPIVIRKETMYQMSETGQVIPDRWDSKFKTLSIFPIIPSVSYTYKF